MFGHFENLKHRNIKKFASPVILFTFLTFFDLCDIRCQKALLLGWAWSNSRRGHLITSFYSIILYVTANRNFVCFAR